jgi:hypothetical protein
MQMHVAAAQHIYQLWSRVIQAAEKIHLHFIHLELHPQAFKNNLLPTFTWEKGAKGKSEETEKHGRLLRLEVPIATNGTSYATLTLSTSLKHGNDARFVLRRIEHLRRTVTNTMEKLALRSLTSPEVL